MLTPSQSMKKKVGGKRDAKKSPFTAADQYEELELQLSDDED